MPGISPDATIADVVDSLIDKEDYLRGVIGNLSLQQRQYGSACVRIGVTGEGKAPHYRIESPPDAPGNQPGCVPFNGRNHKILVDEDLLTEKNWSKQSNDLGRSSKAAWASYVFSATVGVPVSFARMM